MSDPQRTASYLDEITLLRAEVAMWRGIHEGAVAATTADADRLRAEVERLRAALRDIATGRVIEVPHVQAIARSALEKETSE